LHCLGVALVWKLVVEIDRAGHKNGPKSAPALADAETVQIDLTGQGAILKRAGEILANDVVVVEEANEKGEVVVAV